MKYWLASGDVALQKNLYLHGEYNFDVKVKDGAADDYDNLGALRLNFVF